MLWLQKQTVNVQMKELRNEAFSDAEVISNLMENTRVDAALRHLYRENFELLSRYIVNNSGSEQDSEDIFQEVMVAFIGLVRAGKFRGESSIRTFLFSLNKNIWLNELKRRGRAEARELKYEKQNEQVAVTADMAMELKQTKSELMEVIEQLGENCKKILMLFYFENKSMKEIVDHLPYENEQVVRNKKSKCLKKLEEMVTANRTLYQQLKNYLHG
ncbi:MAG: sigma-70 family RNA polymerase sigma factor [Chitinophagaceae bacterium]|nr:MAG: sigma-70 family RNA polymerase sigma factor [Chitinophagaceae bacterium]